MTDYNLASILEDTAATYPDRTAIVFGDVRLTYRQVDTAANQVANLLTTRGIQPGDKVAISCPNIPYFTFVYFGILKAGATVVPLNVLLKAREITYHLTTSDAKAYFCFEGTPELPMATEGHQGFDYAPQCDHFFIITTDPTATTPIPHTETLSTALATTTATHPTHGTTYNTATRNEDDTAVILFTSGTSGQPKGAELRHRNMRDNAWLGADLFGADIESPDTLLCVLPLFHSFGQTVIQNGGFAYGGTIVMLPRFEATSALRLMVDEKVTFFAGVPTMYWALLDAAGTHPTETTNHTNTPTPPPTTDGPALADDLAATLRVAVAGGAGLPNEIHRRFHDRFNVTILEGYGLSETSPVASFSRLNEPARVGSIGFPVPGVEMKLIEPDSWKEINADGSDSDHIGEIAIKGHNIMKGYYGRPEATTEAINDGWFRTGDLGRRDDDGWYYIVDRSKDMIIRGGFNVYPREIEEVLMTHPAVSLAAVIGTPHESHGEEIKAIIIRTPNTDLTETDLITWARNQMASYKYPRIIQFVDQLPMTATGKILKRELT